MSATRLPDAAPHASGHATQPHSIADTLRMEIYAFSSTATPRRREAIRCTSSISISKAPRKHSTAGRYQRKRIHNTTGARQVGYGFRMMSGD